MSAPSPIVSVVMPAWNSELYIAESIKSILDQSYKNLELVVVDDGSTDQTCAIVRSFKDPRIRLFPRPHLGAVPASNFGVDQARGIYIARLDSDDIALPERLERQVAVLDANPKVVLCYTDMAVFGDSGYVHRHHPAWLPRGNQLCTIQMCFRCPFDHGGSMFRKDAFLKSGGYREPFPAEDFDLFIRLNRIGKFVGIPSKLTKYRRHSSSSSSRLVDEMTRNTHNICVGHMKTFLRIDDTECEKLYDMFRSPISSRKWRPWLFFCFRVLHHPESWTLEPLAWLGTQGFRMAWAKLANSTT